MNIIVCVKQVPDTNDIKIDKKTNTLIREGIQSILNPFDAYAIEEALRLKETFGGKITVISMGPPQAEETLRETIALGCDEIILCSDRKFAGADTFATSKVLAGAIQKLSQKDKYDLIFFGQQAIDGDTAQVGPETASLLNIPQAFFVRKIEEIKDGKITLQRLTETGFDFLCLPLPCAIGVVKEINEPRMPSLKGKRLAKKTELITWNANDLNLNEKEIGLNGSPTQVIEIFSPQFDKEVKIVEGDSEENLNLLANTIKEFLK